LNKVCIALAVLAILVLGATVGSLALLLRGGISARVEPTSVETAIAGKLRRLGIPRPFRELRNQVASSEQVVAAGRAHFADHCAICHANDGNGQTELGRNLHPRAPDLRLALTQQLTDGELFYIIENGVRLTGMPAWGDGSEESQRASWHLVTFIRHLPQLSPEEKLEMERLNPKSPEEWQAMQQDEEFLEGNGPSGQGDKGPRHD
jgi:mono/diheme cytochrome c family protein